MNEKLATKFYNCGPDHIGEYAEASASWAVWVVYYYEDHSDDYYGCGEAVAWDGKNYSIYCLGHCSCYGPEDELQYGPGRSVDIEAILDSPDVLVKQWKPEMEAKLRELIAENKRTKGS